MREINQATSSKDFWRSAQWRKKKVQLDASVDDCVVGSSTFFSVLSVLFVYVHVNFACCAVCAPAPRTKLFGSQVVSLQEK